jgi:hypothetical protein
LIYITASGATTVGTRPRGILIQVNTALTGTITVQDGGVTVAVITNPTVGSFYTYYGFSGAVTVNPSATTDISVSILNQHG